MLLTQELSLISGSHATDHQRAVIVSGSSVIVLQLVFDLMEPNDQLWNCTPRFMHPIV